MKEKIRVAFIYKGSHVFFSGKHFDNTYYHFFIDALKRNNRIEVSYFPIEDYFDVSKLKGKFNIILLFGIHDWEVAKELVGIGDLDLPVIARVGDAHKAYKEARHYHEKYKIDHYFGFMHESYFHKYYPMDFKYKTIIFGLESSLYQNLTPFNQRIKDRILNSGAVGNSKLVSKILSQILNQESDAHKHYKLRAMCNELSYVDYIPTLQSEYVNDKYPLLLSKYAAAIAATTTFPTIKYWEIPAAGCLTFMEITPMNRGEYLGFIDNKTAIFIDKNNYKKRFAEYLSDRENPKWEEIASAGRKFVLDNLNNDKAVNHLVDLMDELVQ